jgi:phosphoesterase RecJ-like protein
MGVWSKEKVKSSIMMLQKNGVYLGGGAMRDEYPSLYDASKRLFGSWRAALTSCGLNCGHKSARLWTKGKILGEIDRLNKTGQDISSGHVSKHASGLYNAARRTFGSWKSALEKAGIVWEDVSQIEFWDKEKILETIKSIADTGEPLNYKYAYYRYTKLLKAAEKHIGSWRESIELCGLDYNTIRKDKGKPEFTGKDGRQYNSSLEALVADELFSVRESRKIKGYASHVRLTHKRWWSCDFLVYMNNNTEIWIETDSLGSSRSPPYGEDHPKIRHYIECGLLWEIITSIDQVKSIVERYEKLYQISIKPAVITAHANPDADAVSSCVAVYNHLAEHKIKSTIKLEGTIPSNLVEMIPSEAICKGWKDWVEQVIVLDSGSEPERIGWEIPDNVPLLNIDHHSSRIDCHDQENGSFVIDMCSTAAILVRYFGIKDDVLLAGIYGDTLFRRRIAEVAQLLTTLDIDEDTAQATIQIVDQINSGTVLSAIQSARVLRCRNGFMIVQVKESVPSWALTDIMSIMSRMSESVCLISLSGEVRLRTTNTHIDVSDIASIFGGGGHPFAAGCYVNGKRKKLFSTVRKTRPKFIEQNV